MADYNAGAGETIAGNLARGSGGQFQAGSGGGGASAGEDAHDRTAATKKETDKREGKKTKRHKLTEKEKAEKKAAKVAERIAKLDQKAAQLQDALKSMEGKDDPSNLRKRLSKAIERIAKRRERLASGEKAPSSEDKLIAEAAAKAIPFPPSEFMWAGLYLLSQDARAIEAVAGELPGAKLEDRHHLTLALVPTDQVSPDAFREVFMGLDELSAALLPVKGKIQGLGIFDQPDQRVVYASFDSPALTALRESVAAVFRKAGLEVDVFHGFVPHITLAYAPEGADLSGVSLPVVETVLPVLTLSVGNICHHFTLGVGYSISGDYSGLPLPVTGWPKEDASPQGDAGPVLHTQGVDVGVMQDAATSADGAAHDFGRYIPVVDYVGLKAFRMTEATGHVEALGVVERVVRMKSVDGIKATARRPVLVIGGVAYSADDVVVYLERADQAQAVENAG